MKPVVSLFAPNVITVKCRYYNYYFNSQLLEWIAQTMPWVEDRTPEATLPDTQSRLEEFRQYSTVTKPPKAEEKGGVETHYHTLQTKLRLSNRPAYVPTEGKLVSVSASI